MEAREVWQPMVGNPADHVYHIAELGDSRLVRLLPSSCVSPVDRPAAVSTPSFSIIIHLLLKCGLRQFAILTLSVSVWVSTHDNSSCDRDYVDNRRYILEASHKQTRAPCPLPVRPASLWGKSKQEKWSGKEKVQLCVRTNIITWREGRKHCNLY